MLSILRHLFGRQNGQHGETRVRKKEAGPRSHWKTWGNQWSSGRCMTTGEAPSQLSTFTEQEQEMNDVEKLIFQLQSMAYERIELYGILDTYTNMDLKNRMDSLEMLKKEHKQVMSDLQKLPVEIIDALNRCKRLVEEKESYSLKLRDLAQLKRNVCELRLENRKLWEEQVALQESCEEVRKLLKEAHEKICDPCAEQQQEQESLDERLKDLLKQKEPVPQQGDLADKLHCHFYISEKRSDSLPSELEQATVQDESLLQTELLQEEH
ncbi:disks large homolog 5-like [Peromyscus eremicus]|uniref:disks large homolog 5-like n=1 Tax=Peromyscus eremicus TaxID=42410 RepID=UPI0027DC1B19|nr:disks large homolog 5-like [Peromyscus eremicus]XP_059136278.1 disks large homolog 5-like [Peromyscus eremicus]